MQIKSKELLESALKNLNYHDSVKWTISEKVEQSGNDSMLIVSIKHGNFVVEEGKFFGTQISEVDKDKFYDNVLIPLLMDGLVYSNKKKLDKPIASA